MVCFHQIWKQRYNHVTYVFIKVTISSKRHNCIIICFDTITNFKWRWDNVSFWYVRVKYKVKFVLRNDYFTLGFQKYVFLIKSEYVIFSYVLTTLQLQLQLNYVLVCQFDVPFSASELHYKCFSYNDMVSVTLGLRFLWYVYITYGTNVAVTFRFSSSLWSIFYSVTVTLFICSM